MCSQETMADIATSASEGRSRPATARSMHDCVWHDQTQPALGLSGRTYVTNTLILARQAHCTLNNVASRDLMNDFTNFTPYSPVVTLCTMFKDPAFHIQISFLVLYGPQNKYRLFHYTALTYLFLWLRYIHLKTRGHYKYFTRSPFFLTHWGRVTQICVFTLQLFKTDDANLRF